VATKLFGQLWRIGVIVNGAAGIIATRGIAERCFAVGTHGTCPTDPAKPCCVLCAIISARLAYAASGAAELRHVSEADLADDMSYAQTFAEWDSLTIDPPTGPEAVEVLRARARVLFRSALPLSRHLRVVSTMT
jgi:hypothetical protein